MTLRIVTTTGELRACVEAWKRDGEKIAVVPTMGALHDGHLALVAHARSLAPRSIATVFVNPAQFNNKADLAAYPRTAESDAAKLAAAGADIMFLPDAADMYPPGFATRVTVAEVSEGLCGSFRPGHFEGVATVVAKLFNQTQADYAVFGEKDFQQLHVVQRMVRDLDMTVTVVPHPTVREADGLALSSRNGRLTAAQRHQAGALPRALFAAAERIGAGAPAAPELAAARAAILAAGFATVEYLELRAARDLRPLAVATEPARLLVAAMLGEVRLIDNVPVGAPAAGTGRP